MRSRKNVPDETFLRFIATCLRSLSTARSLKVFLLLKHREWDQLAALACDPLEYLDTPSGVALYSKDTQAFDLIRKLPLPTSFDRRKVAIEMFESSESKCLLTNLLIDCFNQDLYPGDPVLARIGVIAKRAKNWIRRCLGPLPETLTGRFGPGTSFELKGSPFCTVADKVVNTPTATTDCEPIFRLLAENTEWFKARQSEGLPFMGSAVGNRFATVPKDGKTDRGICIEPLGNLFCQLGIGSTMKRRLSNVGIHVGSSPIYLGGVSNGENPLTELLRKPALNGQDVHRSLARRASRDGALATIDLRNASDTISRRLVELLLPSDWYSLLDACRSKKTLIKGRWRILEKFSSMGNGFTFELETLLFLGILHGATNLTPGRDLYCYGDDIIVPVEHYALCTETLSLFGFEPNLKKSYGQGFFRESCGGDYFLGYDVRSLFVKDVPTDPLAWITLYNRCLDHNLHPPLGIVLSQLPRKLRLFGPKSVEGVLHSSDSSLWTLRRSHSITWIKRVIPVPLRLDLHRWASWCHLTLALLGVSSSGLIPVGVSPSGYRTAFASIS
jgi:hypothetical protein